MVIAKAEKVQRVEKLAEGLKESQAVIFADYSGLSVAEMIDLRKRLSQLGAEFRVAKNTLIRLAAEKVKLPFEEKLSGPTAVLFSRGADPLQAVKAVVMFFHQKGKGRVKFGVFSAKGGPASGREWDLLDAARVLELARIPARAVLESCLVWVLNTPIQKLAFVLRGNQQDLVSVLSKIAKDKGGENR